MGKVENPKKQKLDGEELEEGSKLKLKQFTWCAYWKKFSPCFQQKMLSEQAFCLKDGNTNGLIIPNLKFV